MLLGEFVAAPRRRWISSHLPNSITCRRINRFGTCFIYLALLVALQLRFSDTLSPSELVNERLQDLERTSSHGISDPAARVARFSRDNIVLEISQAGIESAIQSVSFSAAANEFLLEAPTFHFRLRRISTATVGIAALFILLVRSIIRV